MTKKDRRGLMFACVQFLIGIVVLFTLLIVGLNFVADTLGRDVPPSTLTILKIATVFLSLYGFAKLNEVKTQSISWSYQGDLTQREQALLAELASIPGAFGPGLNTDTHRISIELMPDTKDPQAISTEVQRIAEQFGLTIIPIEETPRQK